MRDRHRAGTTQGRFDVARNYAHRHRPAAAIFLQNAGSTPTASPRPTWAWAPYRNSCIIRELLGREYYPVEKTIAFQEFAASDGTA